MIEEAHALAQEHMGKAYMEFIEQTHLQSLLDRTGAMQGHVFLACQFLCFRDCAFIELARKHRVATVFAHSEKYAELYDVTGDFIYLRLQESRSEEPNGYSPADITKWARRIEHWAAGGVPDDLPVLGDEKPPEIPRDCFVYVISGAKQRAPAAAMALIEELKRAP